MALPATDNFNRANGGLGANWTTQTALIAPAINANRCQPGVSATDSAAHWSADAFNNDQYAQCKVITLNTATAQAVGLTVRAAAAANTEYIGRARGPLAAATLEVVKKVAGVNTNLGSALAEPIVSGDLLRLTVVGTLITLYLNGVPKIQLIDSSIAAGSAGVYLFAGSAVYTDAQLDDWEGGNIASLTHVVSGTGSVAIATPAALSIAITGRPAVLSSGAANPPNWYHVGMVSWGTANGAITAHPVTRDAELIVLPVGMTTLWYEFVAGVTATIVELAAP